MPLDSSTISWPDSGCFLDTPPCLFKFCSVLPRLTGVEVDLGALEAALLDSAIIERTDVGAAGLVTLPSRFYDFPIFPMATGDEVVFGLLLFDIFSAIISKADFCVGL